MSELLEKLNAPEQAKPTTLPMILKQNLTRLKTIAPQGFKDVNRYSAALMVQVRENPKLAECSHMSIFGAFVKSCQLGLEPGESLGQAYFVPFKNECQLIIGYRGMVELAYRSGKVLSIAARVIYQNDHFVYGYGIEDTFDHVPALGDRGRMIGVYAIAKLFGGGVHFEVLTVDDIEKAKKMSKSANFGPWRDHLEEMAKKTAIRRLFKYLPVGAELTLAVAMDEKHESGINDNKSVAEGVLDGNFEVLPSDFGGGDEQS
jgi:recombination protein RecT